jgi:hypothetical protein
VADFVRDGEKSSSYHRLSQAEIGGSKALLARRPPKAWHGASASERLTTVPESLRNEIFLPGSNRNALASDDERIATLDDYHVFVIVMHMWFGHCGFTTGPERYLTTIDSVNDVAFNSRSRLTTDCDPICGALHEVWEIVHGLSNCSAPINSSDVHL